MRTTARLLAATASLALFVSLTACGDDSVEGAGDGAGAAATASPTAPPTEPPTTAPAPFVALRWVDTGGCEVMGPNCPTYVVWNTGTVEISRTGDDAPPAVTGTLPASEVDAWLASVADLDVDALAKVVGPGSCQSCVDGADSLVTVHTAAGEVTIDSTKMSFDQSAPFFADLERLMTDVRAVGTLPLVTRN
jgi:hypothetical protein